MSAENTASGLDNSYTYDSDGLRLTKTVGDVQHKYVWQGSRLVSENWAGQELEFFYDESGSPYAFSYKASATATPVMYYYVTNLQGDVVNILDASGNIKASYTYNAWGEILSATGDMADINPLRYRGYYFDSDTGLYYLKSRYYDPQLCRFINADGYASTGDDIVGLNMFAYCNNNPILSSDDGGEWIHLAVGAVVGGIIGMVSSIVNQKATYGRVDVVSVAISTVSGAVGGVVAASGIGIAGQVAVNAGTAAVSNVLTQARNIATGNQTSFDAKSLVKDTVVGAASGLIGGNGASYGNSRGIMQAGNQFVKRIASKDSVVKTASYYMKTAHQQGGGNVIFALARSYIKTTVVNGAYSLYNIFFNNRP